MNWSFQLYSARNFQPWEDVLSLVAAAGYQNVEGYPAVYSEPEAFRRQLDRHGLSMPTAHFGLDLLRDEFPRAVSVARSLGIELMVCPNLPPEARPGNVEGWRNLAGQLAQIGPRVNDAGFGFAWHNHAFEFAALGEVEPMRIILETAPDILWEMDLAWLVRGNADPEKWIAGSGDRIAAVHVKDLAPAGTNAEEDGWADVGHGTINWHHHYAELRAKTPAKYFVMEHDKPGDLARFANRSLATVNGFGA